MMTNGAKLSLVLISLTILLMAAFMSGIIKSTHWEINNIEVNADFKRVNSEQIRVTVAAYPERSFFEVHAKTIRNNLIQIPWVQNATVTKKWPDTLIITLIEHKAVAVWNSSQLLNEKGSVFEVDSVDNLSTLPHVVGNNNESQRIWDKYTRFNDIVRKTGFEIKAVIVSNRGGWILNLSNGLEINLGSQLMDARLVRLVDTWSKLLKLKDRIPHYIDLRYTNGYVAKWPQQNNTPLEINKIVLLQKNTGKNNG